MDKYKIISIIEGLIIIVLVVILVSNKINNKSVSDVNKTINQEQTEKTKNYIGIYHTDNYNKTYSDVNFIINSDNTCSFTIFNDNLVNCTYKEDKQDKLILTFTGYTYSNKGDNYINSASLSNGATKEVCLDALKKAKEQTPTWYEGIEDCHKITQDIELTFINNGVMYANKPFYKIK